MESVQAEPIRDSIGTGRSGRIDMGDLPLSDLQGEQKSSGMDGAGAGCDWCGKPASNQYIVVVEDRCDSVCPLCWGRSPDYLELREEEGLDHAASLDRLGVALD